MINNTPPNIVKFSQYKKLLESLNERKLGVIREPITVELAIDNTKHADERKNRHGEGAYEITDKEIVSTVEIAMDKLSEALLKDYIFVNDTSILIKNKSNSLNVIGSIKRVENELVFKVITVMRKHNFKPYKENYVIEV